MSSDDWFESGTEDEIDDFQFTEYALTAAPNDFNIKTLFDFIDSGVVEIPPFQRNYVWDIKRASKLIESLIMGIPIPQVFLYEKSKNRFQVIDGQQRLLSIYYFIKQRFPKASKRTEIRKRLLTKASTPDDLLIDNDYFTGFKLTLPNDPGTPHSPLTGLSYTTLGDHKTSFDLRTIRNIIVKQTSPAGDDSIYEIFNRLNSGGVNLSSHEIRMSLYHSEFLEMLNRMNFDDRWRKLLGQLDADMHLRDVEVLLRGFALLSEGERYKPSMAKFLNGFASKCEKLKPSGVDYYAALLGSFFDACAHLGASAFAGQTHKFTVGVYDAVFAAVCKIPFEKGEIVTEKLDKDKLDSLKNNGEFQNASQSRTTGSGNVKTRLTKAIQFLNK